MHVIRHSLFIVSVLLLSFAAKAVDLNFYLPKEDYNPNVPTPESILGYQVGDWHIRHDQLVNFYKALAASSDRVSIKTIGYSHEQRELLHVTFTSPENHANIDAIQKAHMERLGASSKPISSDYPLVVNMNYSVHGDESSGSNASLMVAYYLAASNSNTVKQYLDNMIIIMDPSLNPDGLSRFAQWANQHKGKNLNADPNNREHIQDWIRGRVNHYWFDLNRDWLLLQHPESQARMKQYHQWRPNVLTDHHEMGPHSTFFFQPGIPSRKNPYTPDENVELTKLLATYHAKAFDQEQVLYFTEESFDDFYAGKGSTYPDLHGTIGILFEQGSSRGHLQETKNGEVDFYTTVKNQVTASFSTLDGSLENKDKLLDFQYRFYNDYKKLAKDAGFAGYLLSEGKDKSRFKLLLDLLNSHKIDVFPITKDAQVDGKKFVKTNSVFVPLNQPQVRLIQSIFSEQTSFFDNTFYDVSSWNLAMAYNVQYAKVESKRSVKVAKTPFDTATLINNSELVAGSYSYAIDWQDFQSPGLIYQLLDQGIQLRTAVKPFIAKTASGNKQYPAGTMVVNSILQKDGWYNDFADAVARYNVKVDAITSGLTPEGIDLGSRNMVTVNKPEVLIVGGLGVSPYEVGETWYLFDKHLGFSPSIIERRRLSSLDLSRYTHIIMTDGSYGKKDNGLYKQLEAWVNNGGVLWGQKRAAVWLAKEGLLNSDAMSSKEMSARFDTEGLVYGDMEMLSGKKRIAGAFFNTELDLTHPLTFGINSKNLPMFKNRTDLLTKVDKPFIQVAQYSDTPLISGYADKTNVEQIANSVGLVAHRKGDGVVVGMTDNPNFRAIMHGTSRLLINTLFLSEAINAR